MTLRVFFVGAGFSKALNSNYPTLFELSVTVTENFKIRYPKGAVREHFDQLPVGIAANAEHLLSYLISDWPWKSSVEKDLDRALYKAFVYEISKAIFGIEDQTPPPYLQEFIQFLFTDERNTIVSLNYDYLPQRLNALYSRSDLDLIAGLKLQVEYKYQHNRKTSSAVPWVAETDKGLKILFVSAEWLSIVTADEFTEVCVGAGFMSTQGGSNSIFKFEPADTVRFHQLPRPLDSSPSWSPAVGKVLHLHGSMLWKDESGSSTIRITDSNGYTHAEDIPAIVPPVLDKSQHYAAGRLKTQWEKAHNAIQRADEIIVIGFSFPPTDMSCLFLFKAATKAGVRVVVVNRDPTVREKYDPVFAGIPRVTIDYSFAGGEDPLARYAKAEILRFL